jgi:hypothetical protein
MNDPGQKTGRCREGGEGQKQTKNRPKQLVFAALFFCELLGHQNGPSAKPIPEGGTKMKKAMFLMLASLFVMASLSLAACGDDDDAAIDNQTACQDAEDTINGLECLPDGWTDLDMGCEAYADVTTCDYADFYNCYGEVYSCDGDDLVTDLDKLTECGDIATEIAGTC